MTQIITDSRWEALEEIIEMNEVDHDIIAAAFTSISDDVIEILDRKVRSGQIPAVMVVIFITQYGMTVAPKIDEYEYADAFTELKRIIGLHE